MVKDLVRETKRSESIIDTNALYSIYCHLETYHSKLDYLYVSCNLMDECPNPPILSPSQTEKIAEERLRLQRDELGPPRFPKLMVPLAPETRNPS